MNSEGEPEVEALTAEIRVLQVGSNSVTRSAARQLDSVDGTEIEPFGRVRIDRKPAKRLIEVIGSVNGVLVRSSAHARKFECPGYETSYSRSYGTPSKVCPRHLGTLPDSSTSDHEWLEYTPSQEIYEAWQKLPLIVLAGIR